MGTLLKYWAHFCRRRV